jgi:hypothetical protein
LPISQLAEQVLQVVPHSQKAHLMATLHERVGDLVLHLRLIGFPTRNLTLHLTSVLGMVPAGVGSVKNNGDAHNV